MRKYTNLNTNVSRVKNKINNEAEKPILVLQRYIHTRTGYHRYLSDHI